MKYHFVWLQSLISTYLPKYKVVNIESTMDEIDHYSDFFSVNLTHDIPHFFGLADLAIKMHDEGPPTAQRKTIFAYAGNAYATKFSPANVEPKYVFIEWIIIINLGNSFYGQVTLKKKTFI